MASLSIPRAGAIPTQSQPPIPGPSEEAFTSTFGTLLPPAQYLTTPNGKAAFYELLPSSSSVLESGLERVLFVHGVQTPAIGMVPLAKTLHSSFPHSHFVLFDLWGHGLSDTVFIAHQPELFHMLIDALLDKLGWTSAHLVGYSFGGRLAVGYAVSRPKRVQSFTLVAPAGLIPSSVLSADDKAQMNGDEEGAQKWVLNWLEGGELVVPRDWKAKVARGEVVAEAVKEWQIREHKGHVAAVLSVVRDGQVFDSDAEFVEVVNSGIPSCVVVGELDGFSTEEAVRKVGFKQISVVQGVGHGVVREMVPEVASLIGEFWKSLDKTAR